MTNVSTPTTPRAPRTEEIARELSDQEIASVAGGVGPVTGGLGPVAGKPPIAEPLAIRVMPIGPRAY